MSPDEGPSEKTARTLAILPLAIMIGILLVVIVGVVIYLST